MSYDTCHTLPPAFLLSSWFYLDPPDPLRCVALNPRIPAFEVREFIPATACVYFIPPCFSLLFDVLHTVINSV